MTCQRELVIIKLSYAYVSFGLMRDSIDPRPPLPINRRRERIRYDVDASPDDIIGWRNLSRRTKISVIALLIFRRVN